MLRYKTGVAIFLLGGLASLHAWHLAREHLDQSIRGKVLQHVQDAEAKLRERMQAYENILLGAAGLHDAFGEVDRSQWRAYGESLALTTRYRGFNALGYVAMLGAGDVAAHEAKMRRWGVPDYRVQGDRDAARLSAVTLLYPDTYTRVTYGRDILAMGPERRLAIERSRDSGAMSVTPPVVPAAAAAGSKPVAIIAYVPVYARGAPRDSVAARRAAFTGFAFVTTHAEEMMRGIAAAHGPVRLAIRDAAADGGTIFDPVAADGVAPSSEADDAARTVERRIDVGGREWVLSGRPAADIVGTWERRYPDVILLLGLCVSAFLAALVAVSLDVRRRAVLLAQSMTAALSDSRRELEQKSAELETVQAASPVGLIRTDGAGRIQVFNHRARSLLDHEGASLAGVHWAACIDADDRDRVSDRLAAGLASADGAFAVECRSARGRPVRWLRVTGARAGEGGAMVAALEDVTARKAAEFELERSREFLRAVLDLLPVVVYARDESGVFVLENHVAVSFLGGPQTSVLGKTTAEVFGEAYAHDSRIDDRRAMDTAEPQMIEGPFTSLDGRRHWVRKFKKGLTLSDGSRYVVGVNIDLTDRHAMETEVRRAKEFVSAVLDALPHACFVKDRSDRYVLVNAAFARHVGRPSHAFAGMRATDFHDPEADRAYHEENTAILRSGRTVTSEEWIQGAEGAGRWMLKTKAPIALPDGNRYIVGVFADIDDRVRAQEELQRHRDNLEALVAQSTRDLVIAKDAAEAASRAKTEFLANMSHELRTPMHAVISYADLGRHRAGADGFDPAKAQQYFDRIHTSARRLLGLLNDLLDLAKLEAGKMAYHFESFDVADLMQEVLREFEAVAADKGVELRTGEAGAGHLVADRMRIGQLLRNLLSNAIKFCPAGRSVTVAWAADVLPAAGASGEPRPALRLSVIDEGIGIPVDELAAVFEKFVQSSGTATGAGGTGLGLSICREIALGHRGRIWAENNAGGGASFHVLLPLEGSGDAAQAAQRPASG